VSYKIAIASGKGGTGKTTLALGLYYYAAQKLKEKAVLVDCDVEEPNDLIFFPEAKPKDQQDIKSIVPELNEKLCTFCRTCVEYCEFNAIVVLPTARYARIEESLCHSCGACFKVCTENALLKKENPVGTISRYDTDIGEGLIEGRLKIGSTMHTALIRDLKERVSEETDILFYDVPPGTSCQVVASVYDMDFVLVVTEPTPFGVYDLKLMVELLEELERPFGIVVNKSGLGDEEVYRYIREKGLLLIAEIPFDREIASKYASGNLLNNVSDAMNEVLGAIMHVVLERRYERNHSY
jgi:MinD superfamily P-loop ATPase